MDKIVIIDEHGRTTVSVDGKQVLVIDDLSDVLSTKIKEQSVLMIVEKAVNNG